MKKKWLWVLVAAVLVLLLAGSLFIIQGKSYQLFMTMHGDRVMAVEVGQDFSDPGATAQSYDFLKKYRDVPVDCQGSVDTNTVGVYALTYQAQLQGIFSDIVRTETRQVHVVESLQPQITLRVDPESYTLPGSEYAEEGFTATDWLDGDITHLVDRQVSADTVTYTVTSSSGYTTTVTRKIEYSDPIAPQITLTAGEMLSVMAGYPFQDPGATALDNLDGDMTDLIQVAGEVDIYRPGTYELTYTVTDTFGNTANAVRIVTVEAPMNDPSANNGKVIYLTFDDGPSNYTAELLDILAKYNVKATFFVVNTGAIGITGRMAAEGHTVAIHTATHNFSYIYASEENFYADLYKMQAIIAQYTGETTYLMRFAGGSSNSVSKQYCEGIMTRLVQSVRANGFKFFDWNVDSGDAVGASTTEEVFQNVVAGVSGKKTAIVLQHDSKDYSVAAVEKIIIWGLANGYTFLPLDYGSPTCAHGARN